MNCRVRKEWQVANKLRAESYMPMALALQQAKKLVSAEGQKTQGPPAEREQTLPSLCPAWRSDTPLNSRRSYASVVAPRPTPKIPSNPGHPNGLQHSERPAQSPPSE